MITFKDGPAAGASLNLARVPKLLRVVVDRDGAIDALDLLSDEAKASEKIHVYRRFGVTSSGFVCGSGPKGRHCARFLEAEYCLYFRQPDDATARDNNAWAQWAMAECTQEATA